MSQTQRCIVCSEQRTERLLWEDEVCAACGRCEEHCTAPHVLAFDAAAKTEENRPHPDAGKGRTLAAFTAAKRDVDRGPLPEVEEIP